MNPLGLRAFALLAAPVLLVFAGLAAVGQLSADAAVFGGVMTTAAVVLAASRIRAKLRIERQEQELADIELHEEFVRQSRLAEFYEIVLDAIPEPVLVLRSDRRIVHANRAAVNLLGHDPIDGDLTGALRHPDVLDAAEEILSGAVQERTVEFSRGGEMEQHLVARLSDVPGTRGSGRAAVIALHDLTAVHNAIEMRADFVANVSHELRTPLATLVGLVETLRGPAKNDAEARERFLSLMEEQGTRMTRLVGDLLSLSQIEADEHARPTQKLKIQEILPTVARMLEPDAKKKDIDVRVEADPGIPEITGDPDQLSQVFQNLVHNAIKYGRERTEVRVVAREEGGILAVSVADQGEGIAAQHIPRLTERFYRVDKARSRKLGGTGLGLAIVKHILKRHQGRLSVHSEEGVGSTFTVYLPIAGEGRFGGGESGD